MLEKLEDDGFDAQLIFDDKTTLHVSGKINKHNTYAYWVLIAHMYITTWIHMYIK